MRAVAPNDLRMSNMIPQLFDVVSGRFVVWVATLVPSIKKSMLVHAALMSIRNLTHVPFTAATDDVFVVRVPALAVTVCQFPEAVESRKYAPSVAVFAEVLS